MKRLILGLVLLIGLAKAQNGFIAKYHPYPNANKIDVRSCIENTNGFTCPHGRVLLRRTAMGENLVTLDLFDKRFPIRFAIMPNVVSSVWNADLNQDRKADMIVKLAWNGNGIIADANITIFALSSSNGYRLTALDQITFDPNALIFLRGKPTVLHTSLIGAKSRQTNRSHNFWVFQPLEVRGSRLIRNQVPVWVQFTYKPSHRPTNKLTRLEKAEALKADPIKVFEPIL
jgi:hypothetical protein